MVNIKSRLLLRESFDWPDSWSKTEWSGHKGTSGRLTPQNDPISPQGGQAKQMTSTLGDGKEMVKRMGAVCLDQKNFCEEPKG